MSCLKAITSDICIQIPDSQNARLWSEERTQISAKAFSCNRASSRLIAKFCGNQTE
jgi:hypothetical protein